MKLVAISQRVDHHPERQEVRDALDQRLTDWLLQAGYLPLPIPNTLCGQDASSTADALTAWLLATQPRALLLSGGNDIGEAGLRDDTERRLLDYARANALPVLGICHGMQMMGVWAGVSLQACTNHVRTRHDLRGEFAENVNSYHNFALSQCPPGFHVAAKTDDGSIEAIRHDTLNWEGWMWHPEREPEFDQRHLERVRRLFQ
jgi:gamma-glutamyl-gamma-aminobutyrate hydrolase PuuD